MKNIKTLALSLILLSSLIIGSALSKSNTACQKTQALPLQEYNQTQSVNMFVTHGHCSTPFTGIVENLNVVPNKREDSGNPLEDMTITFEIDPNSFNVCAGAELTAKIRTPGLFIGENDDKITFRSAHVYTMGLDWYQVNGVISIKGVEKDVKLFATGIRDPKNVMASSMVLEGQLNLLDWGIDYDKIVNGKSDPVPTKWMYINMNINLAEC